MGVELTTEQIQEAIGAARDYCPGFGAEHLEILLELERRLADSGYLEAVRGLARLEREGISCARAMDEYKALLRRLAELEKKTAEARTKLETLEQERQQAERDCHLAKESLAREQQALQQVRVARVKEEQELAGMRAAAAKEKERLDKEVANCRRKAAVSHEEIDTAGKLKAEAEASGFSLDLLQDIAGELAGCENPREDLAAGLHKHRTLSGYLAAMEEQYQEKKKLHEAGLDEMQAVKDKAQAEIKGLESSRRHLEGILSRLRSDLAYEDEIRRFHRRYWAFGGLLDYLASWEQVLFLRCASPMLAIEGMVDSRLGVVHFWTDKPVMNCPHCDFKRVVFDEQAYRALNWPVGSPGRLRLGE